MNVRTAVMEDIPELVRLGWNFYVYGDFGRLGLRFDYNSMSDLFVHLVGMEEAVTLVGVNGHGLSGSICGVLSPWLTNPKQKILTELWWWVTPESRGRLGIELIKEFQRVGREKGASHVVMVTLAGGGEEKLKSVYGRLGFTHLEHNYIKEI